MAKQPIMKFKDLEDGYYWLEYYKKILFLQDWTIKLEFVDADDGSYVGAEVSYHAPEKEAGITIFRYSDEFSKQTIVKLCEQKLLLHELFHIKLDLPYNYFVNGPDNLEKRVLSEKNHQLVDDMAKSMLMAQYNLDFSWFVNK